MKISQDTKQRIKSTFLFLYTALRIMLATLLTVFVYQLCPNPDGTLKDCTFKDNFINLTTFNLTAVIINFITLGIFIGFYLLEYYREHKCIKYLDIDENVPTNNLKCEILSYPKIEKKLTALNLHYRNYSFIMFIVNILNIVISSMVIYQYYGGYKSIVGMLSETFLIVDKLYNSINIAYKSVKEILPYSAYMKDYIIFNTIDRKYKNKKLTQMENIFEIEILKIKIEEEEYKKEEEHKNNFHSTLALYKK
jgi:hypothetical protein